ncbi:MAG TPA: site-2 protease family protein [Candidatus Kapabacteria bacterium]
MTTLETLIGKQRLWLHIALFVITLFSTAIAGVAWSGHNPLELENIGYGMEYALLLLLFLSAHEFGHFIAARIHKVDATLPFYIPFPGTMLGIMPNFGTFGAVIKTRSRMTSKKIVFDVGVAGPIAGFMVCVVILAVGFMTLPGIEYLQKIHPGYPNVASQPGTELVFGKTLLYSLFESVFAPGGAYIPPMSEMYHYPMLIVGWFGLFVTGLNLLPVGQLDGGHLTFSMFSQKTHKYVGIGVAAVLALISLPELFISFASTDNFQVPDFLHSLVVPGGSSWIFWVLMIVFFIRFKHPMVDTDEPIDTRRKLIGYFTMLIFVLSFTPSPLVLQ